MVLFAVCISLLFPLLICIECFACITLLKVQHSLGGIHNLCSFRHWIFREVLWTVSIWDVSDVHGWGEETCVVSEEGERWCVKARLICLWLALIKVGPGRAVNTRGRAHDITVAACYKTPSRPGLSSKGVFCNLDDPWYFSLLLSKLKTKPSTVQQIKNKWYKLTQRCTPRTLCAFQDRQASQDNVFCMHAIYVQFPLKVPHLIQSLCW